MKSASVAATMALIFSTVQASATDVTSIYDANKNIGQWINPNAFFGIVFMLLFFWVCLCMLQALSAVQTPKIMLDKCIDWGKVETVEE